jgi:hypothetical protein
MPVTLTAELERSLEDKGAAVGIVPAGLATEDRAALMLDFSRAIDLATYGRDDLTVKLFRGDEIGRPQAELVFAVFPSDNTDEALP